MSTDEIIMHSFKANYGKILKVPEQISRGNPLPYQRRKPLLADTEVMATDPTPDHLGTKGPLSLYRTKPLE